MTKPGTEWEKIIVITPKTNSILNIKTSDKSKITQQKNRQKWVLIKKECPNIQ